MANHTARNSSDNKVWGIRGDDDTFFGSAGADQCGLYTGGSAGITVDSSQNVTVAGDLTVSGVLSQSDGYTPQVYKLGSIASSIAGATTAGGLISLLNPFGRDVLLLNAVLNLGTAATSAAGVVNIGTNANSNSSSDNIFDGLALTTVGVFNAHADGGTNGKGARVWASNAYVTGQVVSGNVSAASATVYFTAIPL